MSHITERMMIRSTLNNVDPDIKEKIIPVLNDLLAEFLGLALLTKQAHWNMRGYNFISVHEMLDPFNEKLLDYADKIAERAVQLGGSALGRPDDITDHAAFVTYPKDIFMVEDHLNELHTRYATVANHVRTVISDGFGDETTLNILTDASEDLDKYLWFIEAQLEQSK